MGDIYLGLLVLAVLSAAMFVAGRAIGCRVSSRAANFLSALTVLSLAVYIVGLWNQIALVRLLPFSNLIVIGNWLPIAAGFLGGLASTQASLPNWRRRLTATALQVVGVFVAVSPLMGSSPHCGDLWKDGVCLQTTKQTCSPASAATLLRLHGIAASEQEMAELCLTRQGTNWMGLYRGLKKKTANSDWDVEVFTGTAAALRNLDGPAILSVGLSQFASADHLYQTELGWTPGVRHSVVLLRFQLDLVEVSEPTPDAGREQWTRDELDELYLGQGMRLVRRTR